MALEKEIWIDDIVEGLFADNSFLSKAFSADQYVNNKTVHIPNAGLPSGVQKNRKDYPAAIKVREDYDVTFDIDEFTTNPIRITHADTVQLSYDKRQSIISSDKEALHDAVARSILNDWAPQKEAQIIKTTGADMDAYTDKATGKRKALTKADIAKAFTTFNKQNIPATGRYLLLDAMMYTQLIDSLTSKESDAFFGLADVKRGIVGQLYSFNVMMRSEVLIYDGTKPVETGSKTTDNAGALAWHHDAVARAFGDVTMFGAESDPTYYGDIYSFLMRVGGAPKRHDGKGILAIVQDAGAGL